MRTTLDRAGSRRGGRGNNRRMSAARRVRVVAPAVAVLVALTAGCVQPLGPARTYNDYAHKAKTTAESVISALGVANLAAQAAKRDRALPPYLSVLLEEAEDDASGAESTFSKIQPPDERSDKLRDDLSPIVGDAVDTLSAMR